MSSNNSRSIFTGFTPAFKLISEVCEFLSQEDISFSILEISSMAMLIMFSALA